MIKTWSVIGQKLLHVCCQPFFFQWNLIELFIKALCTATQPYHGPILTKTTHHRTHTK